jgi:hypothetical protein
VEIGEARIGIESIALVIIGMHMALPVSLYSCQCISSGLGLVFYMVSLRASKRHDWCLVVLVRR